MTVHVAAYVFISRPHLDASDVPQSRHPAVGSRAEDHIGELFRPLQPAERGQRNLRLLPVADRFLPDLARSHLRVLLAYRVDHIAGCEAPCGELVRVHPNPYAVVPLPHHIDITHPRYAEYLVIQPQERVITQIELVVASVG